MYLFRSPTLAAAVAVVIATTVSASQLRLTHSSSSVLPCSGKALSRCVPWADNPGDLLDSDFTVNITVTLVESRQQHSLDIVPIDTGSTGFLVAASKLGYATQSSVMDTCTVPAFEYLSSSRRYYSGCWVPSDVAFTSLVENGSPIHSNVSVFAVTESGKCFAHTSRSCTDKRNVTVMPDHVQYMGVGFGRWGDEQPDATADKNPLLNIVRSPDSDLRSGFILSDQGLVLGLRDEDFDDDRWHLTHLTPNPNPTPDGRPEWTGTTMCVRVNDGPWTNGTVLFDTGIVQSYLGLAPATVPTQDVENNRLKDGVVVELKAGVKRDIHDCAAGEYIGGYKYTVGGDDRTKSEEVVHEPLMTPTYVQLVQEHIDGGFVNTGRHFFTGFALLFEEKSGRVGLRRKTWATIDEDSAPEGKGRAQVLSNDEL